MSKRKPNVAASIRQKLKNRSAQDKRPFAELLQYYAMERFLYRLSQSHYADRFVLKGALMLRVWQSPEFRPTMDIDMLGKANNDVDNICAQIADVISSDANDGLAFHPDSIRGERIKEDADYEGVRVRFSGALEKARFTMQIDVGFGDIVYPEPEEAELPVLLDSPAPKLRCYSRESAIAEKFEAMIKLGELNSRMKDFYDIWLLLRQFEFEGSMLTEAVRLTLERRGTAIPDVITAFTEDFVGSKTGQWQAFHRRLGHASAPEDFVDLVSEITAFLQPIATALKGGEPFVAHWTAETLWV